MLKVFEMTIVSLKYRSVSDLSLVEASNHFGKSWKQDEVEDSHS